MGHHETISIRANDQFFMTPWAHNHALSCSPNIKRKEDHVSCTIMSVRPKEVDALLKEHFD